LGERLNGIQEVGGSIPPGSTIKNKGLEEILTLCFIKFRHSGNTMGNKIHILLGALSTLLGITVTRWYLHLGHRF
jgi:hypothetical protein